MRKLGRALAAPNADSEESLLSVSTDQQRPPYRQDHRAVSEPSENILASLPYQISKDDVPRDHLKRGPIANSSFSRVGLQRVQTSHGPFTENEPYGINVAYDAENPHVDFVFVHGLGGSPFKTWSWNRDIDYFWPVWLSLDADLASSRILTFGYNANFKGPSSNLNITEFAKDLLLRMLTFSGGTIPSSPIGTVS